MKNIFTNAKSFIQNFPFFFACVNLTLFIPLKSALIRFLFKNSKTKKEVSIYHVLTIGLEVIHMNSHSCEVEALPGYADEETIFLSPEFLRHLELAAKKLALTCGICIV